MASPLPRPARNRSLLVIIAVALLIGALAGVWRGRQRLASTPEARPPVTQETALPAIRDNLRRIADGAASYFTATPSATEVSFETLAQRTAGGMSLSPVAGEDYATVVVRRDAATVKVSLPDGRDVSVPARPVD